MQGGILIKAINALFCGWLKVQFYLLLNNLSYEQSKYPAP
jgi:hypothetical protein